MDKVKAVGVAWYRQEDYAKIRSIMEDHRKLPPTYKQWLKKANKAVESSRAEGLLVEKAYIDPETFPAWCKSRGLNVDAKGRMDFASEAAFLKYRHLD